jgi:peptidoglycan/xylan/chitin deacetylase (PgdA/CDA1 family)
MSGMKSAVKTALMSTYLASRLPEARTRISARLGRGRLTVVTYHQVVDPADDGSSVGTDSFRQQMEYLRENYTVVPLEEGVKRLAVGSRPQRLVAITFDDGYLDNATTAAPIMRALGLPATFFVSTDMIGSARPFPHDAKRGRQPQAHMTWNDLRALAADGFDIGSHTCSHADMGAIPLDQAVTELRASRERLELELGRPVRTFAFPYGHPRNMRADTVAAARREYDICCSADGGHNSTPVDPGSIRRIVISSGVNFLAFRALLEGWPMLRLTNPYRPSPTTRNALSAR